MQHPNFNILATMMTTTDDSILQQYAVQTISQCAQECMSNI